MQELSINGTTYNLVLSAKSLREVNKFVKNLTADAEVKRTPTRRNSGSGARSSGKAKVIREWAAANNVQVPARGRIPADVVAKYDAAN